MELWTLEMAGRCSSCHGCLTRMRCGLFKAEMGFLVLAAVYLCATHHHKRIRIKYNVAGVDGQNQWTRVLPGTLQRR